jgi:hypothetical protein
VWGEYENTWVGRANITPSWGHHDNWLSFHDDEETDGLTGATVLFQTVPSGNYVAWVWSNGYVEADGGDIVEAISLAQMDAVVQYVAFAEVLQFPWAQSSLPDRHKIIVNIKTATVSLHSEHM